MMETEQDQLWREYKELQDMTDAFRMKYDEAYQAIIIAQRNFLGALHADDETYEPIWKEYQRTSNAYDQAQRAYREAMAQAGAAWEAYESTWKQ